MYGRALGDPGEPVPHGRILVSQEPHILARLGHPVEPHLKRIGVPRGEGGKAVWVTNRMVDSESWPVDGDGGRAVMAMNLLQAEQNCQSWLTPARETLRVNLAPTAISD